MTDAIIFVTMNGIFLASVNTGGRRTAHKTKRISLQTHTNASIHDRYIAKIEEEETKLIN